ncbi:MSHA biogenesis protein MshQ [Inhella inkyongensis]|uniref:MSHA biogenesis protein MshQ n=1 Tax=Inhella inkyongensis TaxID=392593 RepID=A0A840S749_9BURK|nr:DUF6701 domain-containing protein [Inhella inkyongensis]MBB5204604.1 MSHA biogenesis protein MshQ [Inhella inkyongensis]
MERSASDSNTIFDGEIRLAKAGVIQTSGSNGASNFYWPTSDGWIVYYGPPSAWGVSLTVADINHSGFGAVIAADKSGGGPETAYIDQVATEICYDTAPTGPHHLQIEASSNTGVTCAPATFTVRACADAACTTYYTGGVSGSLASSNGAWLWPTGASFSIAAGSSSVTLQGQLPVVGSSTLSVASSSPSATSAATCLLGGSTSCVFSASAAGFLLSAPHHVSDTAQTLTVAAVKQSDNSPSCTPAFVNTSKTVTLGCSYVNPGTGTLPVTLGGAASRVAGASSASCGSVSRSLAFNASGQASTSLRYADVGRIGLSASYTGSGADAGLVMSGSTEAVVAPQDFEFSNLPAGSLTAGVGFGLRISARNASGAVVPNFGQELTAEGVSLSHTRISPTGTGAVNGAFSGTVGSFSAGVANPTGLAWSEVGTLALTAQLTSGSYLGAGGNPSGNTAAGAIGPFRPHHFRVQVTPACGAYSYAGQPLQTVTVTARNAQNAATQNYDGSSNTSPNFAQAIRFSEVSASGLGSFSPSTWAASRFVAGVATASRPLATTLQYDFSAKESGPLTLALRAAEDISGGVSSSAGTGTEPSLQIQSGRMRIESRIGSAGSSLGLPLRLETWSGSSWVLATADSCTVLAAPSVALSGRVNGKGDTAVWTNSVSLGSFVAGRATLTLGATNPKSVGSMAVAINLGETSADSACLSVHPSTTGAKMPWLRSRFGSCASAWASDPSARASFGLINAESQKRIHERQLY